MTVDRDEAEQAAHSAICDLVQTIDPGSMVTRFVMLVEVVDTTSERAMWSMCAPDATAWDTLGLLDYARAVEYANLHHRDDGP